MNMELWNVTEQTLAPQVTSEPEQDRVSLTLSVFGSKMWQEKSQNHRKVLRMK
jgi:hypothetical protein